MSAARNEKKQLVPESQGSTWQIPPISKADYQTQADDTREKRELTQVPPQRTYNSIDRPVKGGFFPLSDMSMDGPNIQQRKGCFLDRCKLFLLAGFFICALLVVGLLVAYLLRSPECTKTSVVEGQTQTTVQPNSTETGTTEATSTDAGSGTTRPDTSGQKEHPNVRLPSTVVPIFYNLELQTHLETHNYTGDVSIVINVQEPTKNVTLHMFGLNIYDPVTVLGSAGENVKVINTTANDRLQFMIIHLDKELKGGSNYTLKIQFGAHLRDSLDGFYYVRYKSEGVEKVMATTQYEPVSARTTFPCFDEPAMKAEFNITLVRKTGYTSLSNMPIDRTEKREDGWEADHFLTTPKMSTYLLAFVVSELGHTDMGKEGIKVSVWARPEILPSANYSGTIAPKILKHYEDFFNISYPLKKTDLVAAPDFNAGAMENWGLIIFRENSMLVDPSTTSASTKKKVAQTVAHELAHQWFGNLVTPKWWDDLWLNEGFASYVEYLGTEFVEPTWKMDQLFVVDFTHNVMELDALKSSHPVSVPVYDPVEINEIFDLVSYEKGAAIIRMMDKFLTRPIFLKGLESYLNAKKYDNAETSELWTHLTNAQGEGQVINVTDVMDKWAKQTGFPLVTVTRHYGRSVVTVKQRRFLLQRGNDSNITEVLWDIPLTWADNRVAPENWTTKVQSWLKQSEETLEISNISDDSWIIFNNLETGFYRVNYDSENWAMIIQQLQTNHEKIHVINRAQIINDAFSLARIGEVNYSLALNTTSYLQKEEDYIPWTALFSSIHLLNTMLSRSDIYSLWKKYVLQLVDEQYKRLGWEEKENESILTQFHRAETLNWACTYGNEECVRTAEQKFKDWKENSTHVLPNLRGVVYCTGVREGSDDEWNFVWRKYKNETIPSEKSNLLRALGCATDPWILIRFMRLALNTPENIRLQDTSTALTLVGNTYGREIYFNFIRENYDTIYQKLGNLTFSFSYIIERFADVLNTPFELDELKSFTKSVEGRMGTAKRSFNQALESVQTNVEFMNSNYEEICSWVKQFLGQEE